MKTTEEILKIIRSNSKTIMLPLFCLKKIYIDEKRPLNQIFTSEEIRSNWLKVSQINPNFFNSDYSSTFELRLLEKKIIEQSRGGYLINKNLRNEFKNIDWGAEIKKIKNQTSPLLDLYIFLKNSNLKKLDIDYIRDKILLKDKKLSPSLLEIFSYSVIKTHLWIFGADQNLHRYTKTNANDGGVDIACGDMIYCVTTHLTLSKIKKDAKKQVKNRLTFITINNKLMERKANCIALDEIIKELKVEINIIDLENIINHAVNFDLGQQRRLSKTLIAELENELKSVLN